MNIDKIKQICECVIGAQVLYIIDTDEYWYCKSFIPSSGTQDLTEFNSIEGINLNFYLDHNEVGKATLESYLERNEKIKVKFSNKIKWLLYRL